MSTGNFDGEEIDEDVEIYEGEPDFVDSPTKQTLDAGADVHLQDENDDFDEGIPLGDDLAPAQEKEVTDA